MCVSMSVCVGVCDSIIFFGFPALAWRRQSQRVKLLLLTDSKSVSMLIVDNNGRKPVPIQKSALFVMDYYNYFLPRQL